MSAPKLPPGMISDLRAFTEEFLAAHHAGDYAEDTIRIREGNLNAFMLFLEGKFNPATDKHKTKQAG